MTVRALDLGRVGYQAADAFQRAEVRRIQEGEGTPALLLLEHDPVLTLGAAFQPVNLLHPEDWYRERGIEVLPTDRGGDVTFHGPGQLVAYPLMPIRKIGLHGWLRGLEECAMRVCEGYGLSPRRFAPHTGVWLGDEKVCAIGVKVSRWVSFHGLALNCENDLSPFGEIVPCGIQGYGVTSLSRSIGTRISVEEVKPRLLRAFSDVFSVSVTPLEPCPLSSTFPTSAA